LSWFRPFSAQTAFDPFEYLSQIAKIHESLKNDSTLSNSAKRRTTVGHIRKDKGLSLSIINWYALSNIIVLNLVIFLDLFEVFGFLAVEKNSFFVINVFQRISYLKKLYLKYSKGCVLNGQTKLPLCPVVITNL
jgi:hypothetical protein